MNSIQWLTQFLGALDSKTFEATVTARHEYLRFTDRGLFEKMINAPALLPDWPGVIAGTANPILIEGIRQAMAEDAIQAADAFSAIGIIDGDFYTEYEHEKRWRRLDASGARAFDVLIRKHHLDVSTGLLKAISRALEIEASEHKGTAQIEKLRTLARLANGVWEPDTKQAVLIYKLSRLNGCAMRTIQRHFADMRKLELPEFKSYPWLSPAKSANTRKKSKREDIALHAKH